MIEAIYTNRFDKIAWLTLDHVDMVMIIRTNLMWPGSVLVVNLPTYLPTYTLREYPNYTVRVAWNCWTLDYQSSTSTAVLDVPQTVSVERQRRYVTNYWHTICPRWCCCWPGYNQFPRQRERNVRASVLPNEMLIAGPTLVRCAPSPTGNYLFRRYLDPIVRVVRIPCRPAVPVRWWRSFPAMPSTIFVSSTACLRSTPALVLCCRS